MLSTRAQENLTGVRVVRAYAQEKSEIALFDQANRDYVDRNIKLIGSWSLFFPALTALIGLSFVILLGKGGMQVMDNGVSLGTLWSFYAFLGVADFPDHRARLGDEYFPAWRGVDGTLDVHSHGRTEYSRHWRQLARKSAGSNGNSAIRPSDGDAVECCETSEFAAKLNFAHLNFAYPSAPDRRAE